MDWSDLERASPDVLRRAQDAKLAYFFKRVLPFSQHYRLAWKSWPDVRSIGDLESLPFTSKADIAPTADHPQRPREFVLQPNESLIRKYGGRDWQAVFNRRAFRERFDFEYRPVHVNFTTGRTALPTPFFSTRADIQNSEEMGRRMMQLASLSKEDRLISAFPFAPHVAFWQTAFASRSAGLLAVHTGGGRVLGTRRIIELLRQFEGTVLVGMPGYVDHLLSVAVDEGVRVPSLHTIILGGEAVTEALRERLRTLAAKLDARVRVLATYAFTEGRSVWVECAEGSGYHLYPDLEVVEVIGSDGRPVAAGERGEIVCTPIGWKGTVVVRYRTGDVSSILAGTCPSCGRSVPRISSLVSRTSETKSLRTKVKGQLVDFEALADVMRGLPVREWQAVIRKKGGSRFGLDELILKVSIRKGSSTSKVAREVASAVRDATDVTPVVRAVSHERLLGELGMERELKERRVVDER